MPTYFEKTHRLRILLARLARSLRMASSQSAGRGASNTPHVSGSDTLIRADSVEGIRVGLLDSTGDPIKAVFSTHPPIYAVYESSNGIRVHFSDDRVLAAEQRKRVTALSPLRVEVSSLSERESVITRSYSMHKQAAALVSCLEGNTQEGSRILMTLRDDLVRRRTQTISMYFVLTAIVAAIIISVIIESSLVILQSKFSTFVSTLFHVAQVGGLSAAFSIALRIRVLNLSWITSVNVFDASLRVCIGSICAAFLFTLFQSGLLSEISVGGLPVTGPNMTLQTSILLGFFGGFGERLLPDSLFSRSADVSQHHTDVRSEIEALRTGLQLDFVDVPRRVTQSVSDAFERSFGLPQPVNFSGIVQIDILDNNDNSVVSGKEMSKIGSEDIQSTSIYETKARLVPNTRYSIAIQIQPRSKGSELKPNSPFIFAIDIDGGKSDENVPLRLLFDTDLPNVPLRYRDIVVPSVGSWAANVFSFAVPDVAEVPGVLTLTFAVSQSGAQWGHAMIRIIQPPAAGLGEISRGDA